MKISRAASIPLVLHDPYFSIWSSADHLYDVDTVHWSGARQQIRGYVTVDNTVYCFMGDHELYQCIPQKYIDVTATATEYYFENEKIGLKVRFRSPLLLDDLILVSRPCTYVDLEVVKKVPCEVKVDIQVSSDLVQRQKDELVGITAAVPKKNGRPAYKYGSMGRAMQTPLGNSGDNLTIDWGYVYLASEQEDAEICYDACKGKLCASLRLENTGSLILAYDDLLSINYFGQWKRAYWMLEYQTILDAIGAAFADKKDVFKRADKLDFDIMEKASLLGGNAYAFLCIMSYRHAIAAHKLIQDDNGDIIFLSKENDSNGCIGTVDVSYPSVPLFLLYNTEYVKGMLRPIFKFSDCDFWEFDFAPHDIGRYPYAWGQVYGLKAEKRESFNYSNGAVYPPFYMYPAGTGILDIKDQMPVEECGNMLILTAVVCDMEQKVDFALPYMALLKKWTKYLLDYGADPGEQLCTDDFAGHMSHNVNLSAKAIMGIEAYARLVEMAGNIQEAKEYHQKAVEMAKDWENRALSGDHYMLAFGEKDTWSLKYNLIWDKYFESKLFEEQVYERELAYYIKKRNTYGTPLDSRRDYTKSDWILWCAAMAEDSEQARQLMQPVADYLEHTKSRVPFSDWYETVGGEYCNFIARSVQGGIYMPLLMEKKRNGKEK